MSPLLSARRRAEELAAALDAPEHEGTPLELAELVELVGLLRAQEPPAPRPEFAASLRERLMAEAGENRVRDAALTLPRRRTGTRERRLAIAAGSFVLIGGSAGLAAAAQHALPGDALYPVKRGMESVQSGLSSGNLDKGRDLLGQADTRLTELRGILADDAAPGERTQVPATVHDFAEQARQGSRLMLDSYTDTRDRTVIVEVRRFAADGLSTLEKLAGTATVRERPELSRAATVLAQIDLSASRACPACASDLPALQLPAVFRVSAEADRALDALRQHRALDNSHPLIGRATHASGTGRGTGGDPTDGPSRGGATDHTRRGPGTGTAPATGSTGGSGSTGRAPGGTGTSGTTGSVPDLPLPGSSDGTAVPKLPKLPELLEPSNPPKLPAVPTLPQPEDKTDSTTTTTKDLLQDPVDQVVKSVLP